MILPPTNNEGYPGFPLSPKNTKFHRFPEQVNMPTHIHIYNEMLRTASHFWNSKLFETEPKEKGSI